MTTKKGRLVRIHLLARQANPDGKVVDLGRGEMETGDWVAAAATAQASVGAEVHLHDRQGDPSWRSGIVVGWRWHPTKTRRVIYRFRLDDGLRRTELSGWGSGREQRHVWSET